MYYELGLCVISRQNISRWNTPIGMHFTMLLSDPKRKRTRKSIEILVAESKAFCRPDITSEADLLPNLVG